MCSEPKRSIWRLAGIVCALLLIAALWPGVHPALAQDDEEEVDGDVLFLFDTTTGMADFLVAAHDDAEDLLDALADDCNPGFAVAQYRDWPPEDNLPWHLVQDVTLDRPAAVNAINLLFPDGGGDRPDSVGWALHSSLGISWHEDAVKVIVLVGGAPSHDPDPGADGVYGTDDDLLFADAVSELVAADAKVIGLYTDDSLDTLAYWNGVTEATTGKKATRLRFPDELSRILKDTVCQTIEEAEIEPPPAAPSGSLRGTVFHDANRNRLWDAEESTLPGIPVTVYSPTWEATAYTGDDGTYGVVALAPSWWGVRIAVPDGWQATTPADRWGYLITELGTVYFGLNFGLATGEAEGVAREEAVGEEPTDEEPAAEEVPFILPITGRAAPDGYLRLIAVGLALAAAGLAAIRALHGQGSS